MDIRNFLEADKEYSGEEIETFCSKAFEGQFSSYYDHRGDRVASVYKVTHIPTGRTFEFTMGSAYNRGPNETEIMYSLCLDYRAGEMDYQEFLDTFGYKDDSGARQTYRACQKSGGVYIAIMACEENQWIDSDLFDEMINQY